ncbi:MAG: S8 family serine peptidase [Deltaproteobacteria bacterium]|nr:S8 family serine peptidase [Deltaproteobacteria bacterium]
MTSVGIHRGIAMTFVIMAMSLLLGGTSGCGHDAGEPLTAEVSPDLTPSKKLITIDAIDELIRSEDYQGKMSLVFDEDLEIDFDLTIKTFSTAKDDKQDIVASLQAILNHTPEAKIEPTIFLRRANNDDEIDSAEYRRIVKSARERRVKEPSLSDVGSHFIVSIDDTEVAVKLFHALQQSKAVKYLTPMATSEPTGMLNTPSLQPHQNYLQVFSMHGNNTSSPICNPLNGDICGQDVVVVDDEAVGNVDHADLGMRNSEYISDDPNSGNWLIPYTCPIGSNCARDKAHATMVAGVITGVDNGRGVAGIAPKSKLVFSSSWGDDLGGLVATTDGFYPPFNRYAEEDINPGSVWVVEFQYCGMIFPRNRQAPPGSVERQRGCVSPEIVPSDYEYVKQALAKGVTVILGAGNGSTNFDNFNDPSQFDSALWSTYTNLSQCDSGAIMVGASLGADRSPASWSNCGERIDLFAWGANIATTGYQYNDGTPEEYMPRWIGSDAPVPPNDDPNAYFVNNFGGTSSAAAIIAGVAALTQSKAKQELGRSTLYLMPKKMRDILVASGIPQSSGSCNIGVEPQIQEALRLVDCYLNNNCAQPIPSTQRANNPTCPGEAALAQSAVNSSTLSLDQLLAKLHNRDILSEAEELRLNELGVGLVCWKHDEVRSDPSCPEEKIWPSNFISARTLDVDGDGRGDLISSKNGLWKFDLSSVGSNEDHFGAWDEASTLNFSRIQGKWVWPYALDFNRDGRTDIAMYDKEHGAWYIKYTSRKTLRGEFGSWDRVINYGSTWRDDLQMDPLASRYSRPVPGDYDYDGCLDLAIACSDGKLRIDLGTRDRQTNVVECGLGLDGNWDQEIQYLDEARLRAAPGWAYLSFVDAAGLSYKIPDGLPDNGTMVGPFDITVNRPETFSTPFRGNEVIPVMMWFGENEDEYVDYSFKETSGNWNVAEFTLQGVQLKYPMGNFGGLGCHPISADFDGDFQPDRAVFCPDGWRIEYSSSRAGNIAADDRYGALLGDDGFRRIPLGYSGGELTLPGRPYAGGLAYQKVLELIDFAKRLNPSVPPPIPVDMATVSYCSSLGTNCE